MQKFYHVIVILAHLYTLCEPGGSGGKMTCGEFIPTFTIKRGVFRESALPGFLKQYMLSCGKLRIAKAPWPNGNQGAVAQSSEAIHL